MKETGEKYTKTLRDIKAEVEDERKPGEAFCSDCPDHEACMTNYPCSMVKRVDKENLDARSGEH